MYRYDPEQITFFAKTDARGQEVPFGIKAKDRTRHVYVIGKTGMGKSTLLENMAVQDIKNGNGLAFIDPHGQTAETILSYVPKERINDVLYFAPFDTDYPISFNVMEDVGPDRRHLVVSGLMSVFKKIWVDAWSARMEYILSNTLLALLEYPDSTLLGVNRMLSDKVYRRKVIDNITDPAVKSFWVDEFLNYNERYMQEAGDAIKNKIGQFTANPLIRNIIGQPHSSFDIRQIMDERKILIMNLSKGLVGEQNANLLGSMLTTRIYLAAMSRADLTPEQMKDMPNFYFYVDEFQSFANATFADILSEARKYKLNLTIAHQYIEQMEEEVRNAVFGNVGTTIAFRVGPFDAEVLESIFTPRFLAPDIVNLGFAQIYLTLMIDGIGSQPFSAVTLPPIEVTTSSNREEVMNRSRKLYAHPRSSVEAMINAWHNTKDEQPDRNNNKKNDRPNNHVAGKKEEGRREPRKPESRKPTTAPTRPASGARTDDARVPKKPEPRNEREQKPPRPTQNNDTTVEDLRAVLRGITAQANNKEEGKPSSELKVTVQPKPEIKAKTKAGPEVKSPRQHQQDTSRRDKRPPTQPDSNKPAPEASSLKAALAFAIQAVDQGGKDISSPKVVNSAVVTPEPPRESMASTQESGIKPSAPPAAPASHSPSAVSTDDPLSPKKLERMMRVNSNEKSPLS